ncbi:MAG: hypothetical protein Q8O55_00695 [Dehalococcoidales bacterium]|nr:hypothetical protein [Dehalococcoidales bacterium]
MPGTHYVITSGIVPAVDGELNDIASNVIGNKADTAILVKDDVSSAMRYLKGLIDAAGPGGIIQGGVFRGEVTTYTDTTHFKVAALAGQGTGAFIPVAGAPYEIFVFQADGGAPEGEQTPVVAYTSSDGTFQHSALSVPLAAGDIVLIIHPLIASLGTKATTGATGAVTTADYIAAYIKQLVTNTYRLAEAADGTDVFPASVAEDSLFAKLLGKGNPALGTSFDNTTDSLEALADTLAAIKALTDLILPGTKIATKTSTSTLTTGTLFTWAGSVQIISIIGRVTTVIQGQATTVKLGIQADALTIQDICATLDINAFAVGSMLGITGAYADAMLGTTGVPTKAPTTPINATCITSGIIKVTYGAASTGAIVWEILWIPLNASGSVVAA